MVDPSNRQALRRGLPWTFFGFVALVASVLAWVGLALLEGIEAGLLMLAARTVGVLGALLFGLGLLCFVRARRDGPGGRWLDLALFLWTVELGLRTAGLVASPYLPEWTLGLRLVLVAAAIAALASWMRVVWSGDAPRRVHTSWSATRVLFLLQLAGVVLLATVPGATAWIPERFAFAGVWVAFAAPWIALYVALRWTMRELARQTTVADLLAG